MNAKPLIVAAAGLAVVTVGWAVFRPELLFVNKRVDEAFPGASTAVVSPAVTRSPMAAADSVLRSGTFKSVAHDTKGMAAIHELDGGKRILRLSDFETSNGPDLRVFLVAANDAADSDTVKNAGYIELGALKGNIGDQNYDVPKSVDLAKYKAVTIWCNRFSVNFGTAALR